MTDEEDHFHPAPETPAPVPDDGPPDGYEADWFQWRSRTNRRFRFKRQFAPPYKQKEPSAGTHPGLPEDTKRVT